MTFLHKNKSKLILIFYLIVLAILFIFGLFFMTNYHDVHIAYKYDTDGTMSITERSSFTSETVTNEKLYRYFASAEDLPDDLVNVKKKDFGTSKYATDIYDFNNQLNGYNEFIIIASVISLALCALFFVFSNNSRRIFYKSNLVVGIIVPLIVSILSIVGIVMMVSSISALNSNLNLYRATAAMMSTNAGNYIEEALEDWNVVLDNSGSVNSATFIVGIIIYIGVIAYSLFVSIFTIRKYKQTGKEREEIISRAVVVND